MNIKIYTSRNGFVLSFLLILLGGIFFIIGSVGCNDNSNSLVKQDVNKNYLKVYSSFSEHLKKLDEINLRETDIEMFADSLVKSIDSFKEIEQWDKYDKETKSNEQHEDPLVNPESLIEDLSTKFTSPLMGEIWKEMVFAIINKNFNVQYFLTQIEIVELKNVEKEKLAMILAYYQNINEYPVGKITKVSVSDCYGEYLQDIHNARLSAVITVIAGPVSAVIGAYQYRVAVSQAEDRFDECAENAN